jgi:hypothetical protein
MACDQFPDIFEHQSDGATPQEIQTLNENNQRRQNLYSAVQYLLTNRFAFNGTLPDKTADLEGQDETITDFPTLIGTYGMLLADNFTDPAMGKTVFGPDDLRTKVLIPQVVPDPNGGPAKPLNIARTFVDEMVSVVQEFQSSRALFTNVYLELRDLGDPPVTNGTSTGTGPTPTPTPPPTAQAAPAGARRGKRLLAAPAPSSPGTPPSPGTATTGTTVFARQVAEITRRLVEDGTLATDPQLKIRVSSLLSVVLGDSVTGRAGTIDVSLPNLEEDTVASVIADNVMSCAPLYMAAMLEDYKMFASADYVANDLFMQGMLPLSRGPGGNALYDYIRDAPNRFTATERRTIYAQVLGLAQGSVDVPLPNREFSDLWIRFLSAVSLSNRQNNAASTAPNSPSRVVLTGALVTPEQVFKAAKDLAVNLSLHGYGIGYFAAIELQKLINTVKSMLSFQDVISAFGTKDCWQLVERVSQLYLGGSVNGVRQRTMAQAGANIIQYLAKNSAVLSGALINLDTTDINSDVERWLAVTGTDDTMVDKYSAPVAVTQQPTIPTTFGATQGMDLVRNALQQVGGIAPGMLPNIGLTNGMPNIPKA